jgi:hypothetical protein
MPLPPIVRTLWATGALLACVSPVSAQLQGRVADADTGEPIEASSILLMGSRGDTILVTETRGDGRFAVFEQLEPGEHLIQASSIGYDEGWTLFDYAGAPMAFEFRLTRAPVELEGLEVEVDAEPRAFRKLDLNGFYDRQQKGFGDHLDFGDPLSKLGATRPSHLIRRLAGVSNSRSGEPYISRGPTRCLPVLVLDGVVIRGLPSGQQRAFDDVMPPPEDILAAEVYRSVATTPPQWVRRGMCGAIVVWTR